MIDIYTRVACTTPRISLITKCISYHPWLCHLHAKDRDSLPWNLFYSFNYYSFCLSDPTYLLVTSAATFPSIVPRCVHKLRLPSWNFLFNLDLDYSFIQTVSHHHSLLNFEISAKSYDLARKKLNKGYIKYKKLRV